MGKQGKRDVQEFSLYLIDNIFSLHDDLIHRTYQHGGYQAFNISDPKPRNIHKATIRDRLLHRAIYRTLYSFFDRTFIADSYSCRIEKGTHKAMWKFQASARKVSHNDTRTTWILKCDIKKFFASINQEVLLAILQSYIPSSDILWLLEQIIRSFHSTAPDIGLPLGNLTSQLLANIYMNEFDQFMKHKMKAKQYIRYADDFVILSADRSWLEELLPKIGDFLSERLKLKLHPDKVVIKTLVSGIDFLGCVHFPDHRVLRTTTKRRMLKTIGDGVNGQSLQSYLGVLKHCNSYGIVRKINEQLGKN